MIYPEAASNLNPLTRNRLKLHHLLNNKSSKNYHGCNLVPTNHNVPLSYTVGDVITPSLKQINGRLHTSMSMAWSLGRPKPLEYHFSSDANAQQLLRERSLALKVVRDNVLARAVAGAFP